MFAPTGERVVGRGHPQELLGGRGSHSRSGSVPCFVPSPPHPHSQLIPGGRVLPNPQLQRRSASQTLSLRRTSSGGWGAAEGLSNGVLGLHPPWAVSGFSPGTSLHPARVTPGTHHPTNKDDTTVRKDTPASGHLKAAGWNPPQNFFCPLDKRRWCRSPPVGVPCVFGPPKAQTRSGKLYRKCGVRGSGERRPRAGPRGWPRTLSRPSLTHA